MSYTVTITYYTAIILIVVFQSGLTQSCRESTLTLANVEELMVDFLKKHVPKGKCPLAGNSVHYDRVFLCKYMPKFTSYLHYRIVDVSSIKELCR